MSDDIVYLRHILERIQCIESHVAGGHAAFFASELLQDATLRNLQTLSEATQRLSDTAKATHPEIPWPQIAAFHTVLVHNYLAEGEALLQLTDNQYRGQEAPRQEADLPVGEDMLKEALAVGGIGNQISSAQQLGVRPAQHRLGARIVIQAQATETGQIHGEWIIQARACISWL